MFKQQQPVRAAFPRSIGSQSNASVRSSSSTSSSSSAAAGKSLSASAVPSKSASASAPKAVSTTQSHLPPRIIHVVGEVAASGSSSSRRAAKCDTLQLLLSATAPVHIAQLPCGHEFCAACVRRWLSLAATCPTCRYVFPDDLTFLTNLH